MTVRACIDWDYASYSNTLKIQLKGFRDSSDFVFVNNDDTLPIYGNSKTFFLHYDMGRIGELHSIVLTVDDPHGYCISGLSVHIHGIDHFFDAYHFGTGVVLSKQCKYSYKSISPHLPLLACFDDYFELYTYRYRGIYKLIMHTCTDCESGISAKEMEHNLYTKIMGKKIRQNVYATTQITYLDHYLIGNVRPHKLGHVIAGNVCSLCLNAILSLVTPRFLLLGSA